MRSHLVILFSPFLVKRGTPEISENLIFPKTIFSKSQFSQIKFSKMAQAMLNKLNFDFPKLSDECNDDSSDMEVESTSTSPTGEEDECKNPLDSKFWMHPATIRKGEFKLRYFYCSEWDTYYTYVKCEIPGVKNSPVMKVSIKNLPFRNPDRFYI